jgi:probable aminopeptidase NPEPL1
VDDSTLVVLGAKQRLLDAIHLLPESARPVWSAIVDAAASTSADNGGTSTTWLAPPTTSSGGKARKLVCVALPSVCSRHNCEAQPHAVSTLLLGVLGSSSATVLLVIPAEHALATACAVARAVPVFSLKTSSSDKASETAATEKVLITAHVVTETGAPSVTAGVLSTIQAAADGVRFASRLVDTPPEEMSTTALRQEARTVADSLKGVTYTEIVGTQLRDGGFGGLWGVGKAAVEPPALVILSYTPSLPIITKSCLSF